LTRTRRGGKQCNEEETPTPATTTPAVTTPVKTTPAVTTPAKTVSTKPVKIGVIQDWSGPGALAGYLSDAVIKFAEWYFNEKQGGIQVGDVRRPVEFIKYDNKGQVAEAAAGAKKALLDGCVAVTQGGISNQFAFPIADVTDPANVLYSTYLTDESIFEDYKWTVGSFFNNKLRAELCAELVVKKLNAKTVGILCHQLEVDRLMMKNVINKIQALDPQVKVVYEEYYPLDARDLSPYLTKVKYEKSDVLIALSTQEAYVNIARQSMELGGLDTTKFIALVEAAGFPNFEKMKGTQGWYVPQVYLPGYGASGAAEHEALWGEKCAADPGWCKKYSPSGSKPLPTQPIQWNPIMVVVKAIEIAGTDDPAAVARAARSGKLEFDSPLGYLNIGTDGLSNIPGFYTQVQGRTDSHRLAA